MPFYFGQVLSVRSWSYTHLNNISRLINIYDWTITIASLSTADSPDSCELCQSRNLQAQRPWSSRPLLPVQPSPSARSHLHVEIWTLCPWTQGSSYSGIIFSLESHGLVLFPWLLCFCQLKSSVFFPHSFCEYRVLLAYPLLTAVPFNFITV